MPIPGRFPTGMKIFQIPLSWFRKVTAWLNNFCGGTGILVTHPTDPSDVSPVMVSIDREWLKDEIKNNTIDSDHLGKGTGASATATSSGATATDEGSFTDATVTPNVAITKNTTAWTADVTKTPLELFVFSRYYRPQGTSAYRYLMGRKLTFSPNGRLLEMSGETVIYRIKMGA